MGAAMTNSPGIPVFTEETAQRIAAALETMAAKDSIFQYNGAGLFNAIPRGKSLGTTSAVNMSEISDRIRNGFDDLFCGDTLTGKTSGRLYDLAHADYRLGCGDTALNTHHILVIPRLSMGSKQMNEANTTEGAYVGSKMYTENLQEAIDIIMSDFGSDHVLPYRTYLQNVVADGKPSAGAWYTRIGDLMNEPMVFGCYHFNSGSPDGVTVPCRYTIDNSQVALFRHRKDLINPARYWWWLRDVVSAAWFAGVYHNGNCGNNVASYAGGVRPAFLIY